MLTPNKYLLPEEEASLRQSLARYRFQDLRNTTMLLFMLETGSRPQECLNVLWSDVSFSQKTVFLRTLKGGRPRTIPLSDDLTARLLTLNKQGLVKPFPINRRRFGEIWHLYRPCQKVLHSLRHTYAHRLYERTKDVRLVSRCVGHKNVATTDIYLDMEYSLDKLRIAHQA